MKVVRPGGVLLHAQFWDLNVGQQKSWGIHGLWYVSFPPLTLMRRRTQVLIRIFAFFLTRRPDYCTGSGESSYYEDCDSSRAYSASQISSALQSQTSLLSYMNDYWNSNDDSNVEFWQHEVRARSRFFLCF